MSDRLPYAISINKTRAISHKNVKGLSAIVHYTGYFGSKPSAICSARSHRVAHL